MCYHFPACEPAKPNFADILKEMKGKVEVKRLNYFKKLIKDGIVESVQFNSNGFTPYGGEPRRKDEAAFYYKVEFRGFGFTGNFYL